LESKGIQLGGLYLVFPLFATSCGNKEVSETFGFVKLWNGLKTPLLCAPRCTDCMCGDDTLYGRTFKVTHNGTTNDA